MKIQLNKIKFYKIFRKTFLLGGLVFFSLILFSNLIVFSTSYGNYYNSLNEISHKKVAIILGTSKYIMGGDYNLFYNYRLDAAKRLIDYNKVDYLLLSGYKEGGYDEPSRMKADLIKKGVPEEKIYLDFKGIRTWDSIIRMKEVFNEDDFIIVSQQFHVQRALFIAKYKGIEAKAYVAKSPKLKLSFKTYLREFFARIKLLFDIVLQKEKKYINEKLEIG